MTLRHLKIFVAVVNNNSITKASQELYLAQPAVSLAIKELEEYYHTKLFSRIGKKLYITDSGSKLYEYATRILELYKMAGEDLSKHNYTKTLKIGSSITLAKVLLGDLIKHLKDKYQDIKIEVVVKNAKEIMELLRKNEIDIAIILVENKRFDESLEYHNFLKNHFSFVCSCNSPLNNKTINKSELAKLDFIVREEGSVQKEILSSLSKLNNDCFNMPYVISSNELIKDYVKNDFGVSLLSDYYLDSSIGTFKVKGIEIIRDVSYVIHPNKYKSDLLTEAINYLDNLN